MFCPNCGKEILPNASVCLNCGVGVNNLSKPSDSNSVGWWWLGFFIPIAGFIIWAVCSGDQPVKAKKAGVGALVGVITSVILIGLFYALFFGLMFFSFSYF